MSLRTLAAAVLLTSALLGCRATSPVAVTVEELSATSPELEAHQRRPKIVRAEAQMGANALRVRAVVNLPASSFGERWTAQLYFDTDRSMSTGIGGGVDLVGRLTEGADGKFPVRQACHGCSDPDPAAHGWGPIVGYGSYELHGHQLKIVVPLSTLSDHDGLFMNLAVFDGDGALADDWNATVLPHGRGHAIVERGSMPAPRRL